MATDEGPEYYFSRKKASVAMSRTAKETGIEKIHLVIARRYADLAGSCGESR